MTLCFIYARRYDYFSLLPRHMPCHHCSLIFFIIATPHIRYAFPAIFIIFTLLRHATFAFHLRHSFSSRRHFLAATFIHVISFAADCRHYSSSRSFSMPPLPIIHYYSYYALMLAQKRRGVRGDEAFECAARRGAGVRRDSSVRAERQRRVRLQVRRQKECE